MVKIVKQETTYHLWQKYSSVLSRQYWKEKTFLSDGYFACSIGEVSSATIQKYIESQGKQITIYEAPPTYWQWVSAYDKRKDLFMKHYTVEITNEALAERISIMESELFIRYSPFSVNRN